MLRPIRFAALLLLPAAPAPAGDEAGPLVSALWLVHRHGIAEAVDPDNDASTKGRLSKAMGPDGTLTAGEVQRLIDRSTFDALAGSDGTLDAQEVEAIVTADVPESRDRLIPEVRAHADLLTTSFDLIDPPHRQAGGWLADWIATNYEPGKPLHVTVICTGNSRRSMIGATMGNIAASYYGMPEVRFHSGGTDPSAFNKRTIAALREIGVAVESTGDEAPRGDPETANPVYTVRWGRDGDPAMEAVEFSKTYGDPSNPQEGFAAILVCGEADAACPSVAGAAIRIPMPYLDPKIYDDSRFEADKYAERRDDIGRLMLDVMMQVRHRVAPTGDAR